MTLRFKQFIKESEMDLHGVTKAINTNCQPFLSKVGRLSMYRGLGTEQEFKTPKFSRHPLERTPRDSTYRFNLLFNTMIHLAFGEPDVRFHSFFAVGDIGVAAAYGNIAYVYPKGEFKFIWSPRIEDSVYDEAVLVNALVRDLCVRLGQQNLDFQNKMTKCIKQLFSDLCTHTSASADVVDGSLDVEIERIVQTFNIINDESLDTDENQTFSQMLRDSLQMIGKKYYSDEDIHKALESNHEILIYQSGGYYSIPLAYASKDEIDYALTL